MCHVTQMGWGGGCQIYRKKHYEGVRFNVISVMMVGGGLISRKKHYVTLEWPQSMCALGTESCNKVDDLSSLVDRCRGLKC